MPLIPNAPEAPLSPFEEVTSEEWKTLESKRFFFGHQSVGENMMEGIATLLDENPHIPIRIVESPMPDPAAGPGLYHARIGRNGDPASKTRAFEAALEASGPDIGILKYCYVDVTRRTDPSALFQEYRAGMEDLRSRDPDLQIVHVTMPLTTIEGRRELLMKWLRREDTARDLNVVRNQYNALLRKAYVGKEPVFDLARIESTTPDGRRTFFTRGGSRIHVLAPELTTDGGHLNPAGQRAAARELLALLAGL